MNFLKKSIFIVVFVLMYNGVTAQKVRVEKGSMMIDTTFTLGTSTSEETFRIVKKWGVKKMSNFNDMIKGEVSPELLKMLKISTYWAAGGTQQEYSHDVTFTVTGTKVQVMMNNFKTYIPEKGVPAILQAEKSGWSGDKFFISKKGELKNFPKFYADIQKQFKGMILDISNENLVAID